MVKLLLIVEVTDFCAVSSKYRLDGDIYLSEVMFSELMIKFQNNNTVLSIEQHIIVAHSKRCRNVANRKARRWI